MSSRCDLAHWHCRTTVRTFGADVLWYLERFGPEEGLRRFYAENELGYELVREGNLLTQTGINQLWLALTGGAFTAFSNANARIGVGNSNVAAQATDTDLLGTSASWKTMEAGYPLVSVLADRKVSFRSIFGATEGNHAWEEWGLDNGAAAHKLLNRKVESLGTKSSGSWQITVEISLS
ncbi:MAG: hypothetical protein ACE149_06825 [Armatimonadota bacterium]